MKPSNWCCERSFRFAVKVDFADRILKNYPLCLRVDFDKFIEEAGGQGTLDKDSLIVVKTDPATGNPLVFDASLDDERKYHIPHRLFWDHQTQDLQEKLAWIMEDAAGVATYAVYFDLMGAAGKRTDCGTRALGAGEPFICSDVVLNVGFTSTPAAVNWGEGGRKDLVVGTVSSGSMLRYYANIGDREAPLFQDGVRLKAGGSFIRGMQPCSVDWNGDGVDDLLVMAPVGGRWDERILVLYEKMEMETDGLPRLEKRERIELEKNEFGEIVSFAAADWDGDGLWDLLVARTNTAGACRFFFHKNIGDHQKPSFAAAKLIPIDGEEMMAERNRAGNLSITAADWLGDGRLHLLVGIGGDKDGKVLLFENMAFKPGEPCLTDGRPLTLKDGSDLRLPRAILANPIVVDWDDSGSKDLLAGSHRGLLYLCKNECENGSRPALGPPEAIKVRRGQLAAGSFATPALSDWDGDGDLDLVIGGEYGQLIYFENVGDRENPLFECRGEIRAGGNIPRAPGAHLQGADEYWGYTSPIAIDWDQDGKDDLIVGESRGFHTFYKCRGVVNGELHFADGVRLESDGKALRSAWRTKPALWPVEGRRDLIATDLEGYAVRYRDTGRRDRPVFAYAGRLVLENGQEFRPFSPTGNNPLGGRTRYVVVDWNGDGVWDLLMSNNEAMIGSGILYYENSGTNEDPVFFRKNHLMVNGREIRSGSGHAVNPCATDWFASGLTDLVVGNDDGSLHLYRSSFFAAPPAIEIANAGRIR